MTRGGDRKERCKRARVGAGSVHVARAPPTRRLHRRSRCPGRLRRFVLQADPNEHLRRPTGAGQRFEPHPDSKGDIRRSEDPRRTARIESPERGTSAEIGGETDERSDLLAESRQVDIGFSQAGNGSLEDDGADERLRARCHRRGCLLYGFARVERHGLGHGRRGMVAAIRAAGESGCEAASVSCARLSATAAAVRTRSASRMCASPRIVERFPFHRPTSNPNSE